MADGGNKWLLMLGRPGSDGRFRFEADDALPALGFSKLFDHRSAEGCKTSVPGSNPGGASNFS